jgi:hypothetical protein
MQAANSNEHFKLTLPFVGRTKESARLQHIHAQRKHALILGTAGLGKTELVAQLKGKFNLLVCPEAAYLGSICGSLEAQFGLEPGDAKLVQRKQRLRRALADAARTVVFDAVSWTTPKLGSFLEGVMERVPIWICMRSEHSWDIGHFWPLLARFVRVELQPLRFHETQTLVATAVQRGTAPVEALEIVGWLHRASAANPEGLGKLLNQLAKGHYDVRNPRSLRLLKLDCRIHDIPPGRVQARTTKGPPPA